MKEKINYLDSASTTKIDKRVLDKMLPYFSEVYSNASSIHEFGKKSKNSIEKARIQVSKLINSNPNEIIFTSGSTEAINFAVKGYLESNHNNGNHIITVKTEHKAVLKTFEYLENRGYSITYLDVNKNGLISLSDLEQKITDDTSLICVMYVNNETGVIQPISKIGKIAKKYNLKFFCDATQAVGKIKLDVESENIDFLCLSAHKFNGPKGIGALYVRNGIKLAPLIHGGDQEFKLRAGTLNTPLIVGLGYACEIINNDFDEIQNHLKILNNYLIDELNQLSNVKILVNTQKVFSITNIQIKNLFANIFIEKNKDLAVSNGSACTSQLIEGSHVLKALGLTDDECNECIRVSFDKFTTKSEIDFFIKKIKRL